MTDPTSGPFKFLGGSPALDFTNTVDQWDAGAPFGERLVAYADLVRWGEGAGVVDRTMARLLLAEAARRPRDAARVLAEAHRLRALIYRLFAGLCAQHPPSAADLDAVTASLLAVAPHRRLAAASDGFAWGWDDAPALDRPLWPVLQAAADLLVSDRLPRVRTCDGERCHWLFLDETKNRSRRWCDMSVCGNRAKARRHYDRSRAASDARAPARRPSPPSAGRRSPG